MKEIYNHIYETINAHSMADGKTFKADFYGWHLDGNKPVYRMPIGVAKRSYVDICVDTTYVLCDSAQDAELFEKLLSRFSEVGNVKRLAFRKKSNQLVFKLDNVGFGTFIDMVATTSIYKLQVEETYKKVSSKPRGRKKQSQKAN